MSGSTEGSVLVAALEDVGRLRARAEGEIDAALSAVVREETASRKMVEEGHRRLVALRALRREQEERRAGVAAEAGVREARAVREGMAADRQRFLERVRLVAEAVDARDTALAADLDDPSLAASVREYENYHEVAPTLAGMPAPIRKQVVEQHARVCRKLETYIRAANAAPPPLAEPPLGIAVLAATEPAEGRPEALLVVLPVPYSVYSDWRERREDLATMLAYRLVAATFRVLGGVGAADAPVRYDEMHGSLAIQVWLGDHPVEADLRERMLEEISVVYEEAEELWAAGVEVYGVWVRPELLTAGPE